MAIHIIEGVPGAGKTYYAVKHLLDNYFSQDPDGTYKAKKPIKIITNVDGFALPHENLIEVTEASGGINRFFSKDFQEQVFEKHGAVVYMIDEAQMIFDRKFYDRNVFSWFEYHRHFGQTIYLITQAANKLPRDVSCLVETIIRALPRSRSITGMEFRYNFISGSHTKLVVQKIDKKVFDIYKSAGADEVEKVKNPFIIRIGLVVVAALVAFFFGWKYIFDTWGGAKDAEASVPESQIADGIPPQNPPSFPGAPRDPRHPLGYAEETRHLPDTLNMDFIPHPLNFIAVQAGKNSYVKIIFEGRIYTLRTFPYTVEAQGNDLVAMIPREDYFYFFPTGRPERTAVPVEEEEPIQTRRFSSMSR